MTRISFLICAVLAASAPLEAGPVNVILTLNPDQTLDISLDPVHGILSGFTGSTVGWGLTVNDDSAFDIFAVRSDFCPGIFCSPDYTDLIAFGQSLSVNAGDSVTQSWDGTLGFGSLIVPGSNISGQLEFEYYLTDTGGTLIPGSDNTVSTAAEVDAVPATVPEPAAWPLAALALVGLRWRQRRQARSV